MNKVGVGIIGCGNISGIYFQNCTKFRNLEVLACADLVMERAQEKAKEFNVTACTVKELLADPRIKIVINLTIPPVHSSVNMAILKAGKNAYVEKPLGLSIKEAKQVTAYAKKHNLLLGGAPDTFMGAGIQGCRQLMDKGVLGKTVGFTAFMLCRGHETWHPDPEFYYQLGGGPMFDMGPYYLTALVNLLGPVKALTGMTRITFPTRKITSKKKFGKIIKVEVPTTHIASLEFANGAIGTLITSFDVGYNQMPAIEIYGEKGSMRVPDPNGFGEGPLFCALGDKEWTKLPNKFGFARNSRGVGVSDMADAIIKGGSFRPNFELTFHVLEIMQGVHESARSGKKYMMKSTCKRPAAMPAVKAGTEYGWNFKGAK